MAAQWTQQDPGAGSAGSLHALAGQLRTLEGALDAGQRDLGRADDVFDDDWTGLSAAVARAQVLGLQKRAARVEKAVRRAYRAIDTYAAEVLLIQAAAAVQRAMIVETVHQLKQMQDQFVIGLAPLSTIPLLMKLEEARSVLNRLAERRAEADAAILGEVRAAVATTWDVDPAEFPERRNGVLESNQYDYQIDDSLGVSTKECTPEELMDLFKKHPTDIFPFSVSGDSKTFTDGAVFTLSDTLVTDGIPEPYESGEVVVTTTGTSVKFTVISDGYFEGPGSTIEFSIVEVNGEYVLRKTAHAVNGVAGSGIIGAPAAASMWDRQAENFRKVIADGRKR